MAGTCVCLYVMCRCTHYFCEACALKQYKKSARCFVCGQQTSGIFNPAKGMNLSLNGHLFVFVSCAFSYVSLRQSVINKINANGYIMFGY